MTWVTWPHSKHWPTCGWREWLRSASSVVRSICLRLPWLRPALISTLPGRGRWSVFWMRCNAASWHKKNRGRKHACPIRFRPRFPSSGHDDTEGGTARTSAKRPELVSRSASRDKLHPQLHTAHQEGQRDRPVEAPATTSTRVLAQLITVLRRSGVRKQVPTPARGPSTGKMRSDSHVRYTPNRQRGFRLRNLAVVSRVRRALSDQPPLRL